MLNKFSTIFNKLLFRAPQSECNKDWDKKSMQAFLACHSNSPYSIRFSTHNYSEYENIHSYPLYAIIQIMCIKNTELRKAIENLIS